MNRNRTFASRTRIAPVILALVVYAISASGAAAYFQCVGDCDGLGTVGLGNVLTLLSIALGKADPSDCYKGTSVGSINVAWIVEAVRNVASGCSAPPDVSAMWHADQHSLISSDCTSEWTAFWYESFVDWKDAPTCGYELSQDESLVTARNACTGENLLADVDTRGILRSDEASGFGPGVAACQTLFETLTEMDAILNPTIRTRSDRFTFYGTCGALSNCKIVSQSRWRKL